MSGQKTHHRRVPRKAADIERAHLLGLHERPDEAIVPRLWPCFFELARRHGFCFPADDQDMTEPRMTAPRRSDFPPEEDEDLDIERRCGKPFTDTIGPDRYALSLESLLHPGTRTRVSAVYVRQRVFHAFFEYLNFPITLARHDDPPEPPSDSADIMSEQGPFHSAELYSGELHSGEPHSAEPHGIVYPSPLTPRRLDVAESLPTPIDPQSTWITHFRFEVDDRQTLHVIRLPHNRLALNKFFEKLVDLEFHIQYSPEILEPNEEARTISYMECYPRYLMSPHQIMRAVYCQGCPVHPVVSVNGQRINRTVSAAILAQAFEQVQRAEAEAFEHHW